MEHHTANKTVKKSREDLLKEEEDRIARMLCTCKDGWPRNRWRRDESQSRYIHQTTCPSNDKLEPVIRPKVQQIAEEMVSLKLERDEAMVKSLGSEPDPVIIPLSHYYIPPRGNDKYTNECNECQNHKVLLTLATSLGGTIVSWGRSDEDSLILRARYIDIQPDEKKEDKYSYTKVLSLGKADCTWDKLIVFPNEERARYFVDMAKIIKNLITMSYNTGKEEGQSMLMSLASGEITMDQFNKKTMQKDEYEE